MPPTIAPARPAQIGMFTRPCLVQPSGMEVYRTLNFSVPAETPFKTISTW